MKNNANKMNLDQNQEPLNEQQLSELENDAVWSLLNTAEKDSAVEVSPMFARNVMREIRVNHSQEIAPSFWQRLIAPKFNKVGLTLGAVAACAVLVITQITDQYTGSATSIVDTELPNTLDDISFEDITNFAEIEEENFTDEMLDLASQDPFYISEEEIEIAMQM
ncbi:MAG: hypothetical protein ACI9E1_000518 [Cryomorphaceae bacterium]|jgi:hypothetical protein